jgi:hypothetical protein
VIAPVRHLDQRCDRPNFPLAAYRRGLLPVAPPTPSAPANLSHAAERTSRRHGLFMHTRTTAEDRPSRPLGVIPDTGPAQGPSLDSMGADAAV